MPDWLKSALDHGNHLPATETIVVRVGLAMVFGFIVAGVHRISSLGREEATKNLPTTLALLAVLISLVTVVIGDNIARAFGLVGALSIVRFRSVVKDTRDTAFVIFAVIVGMAVGAGYLVLATIAVPAVTLTAMAMARTDAPVGGIVRRLSLQLPCGVDVDAALRSALEPHLVKWTLKEVSTAQKGSVLEVTFVVRLRNGRAALPLVAALQLIPGIENIKLRSL